MLQIKRAWPTNLTNRTHLKNVLKLLIHDSQSEVPLRELLQKLRLLIHWNDFVDFIHESRPVTHA